MIGVSPEFRTMRQLQDVDSPCDDNIVGVQLHTFTRNSNGNGALLASRVSDKLGAVKHLPLTLTMR